MRIQHNIPAMNAYRNYMGNSSALSKNLEKLSSGYRINRAGDDAAGLAISEKMRAQLSGLDQAQRNVDDGISLVKTAEGALQEVHDMLNRMVTLATQSANGTYDNTTDRANLQKEVDQLKSEIDRIADSSNFNGIKLLDGSLSGNDEATMTELTVTSGTQHVDGVSASKGSFSVDLSKVTLTNNSTVQETFTVQIGSYSVAVDVAAGATANGNDIAKAFADKINGGSVTFASGGTEYNLVSKEDGKLVFEMKSAPTTTVAASIQTEYSVNVLKSGSGEVGGSWSQGTQGIKSASPAIGTTMSQATFDITSVKDGTTIKLGDTTYTFAVGANSKFKDAINKVDLTNYEDDATKPQAFLGLATEAFVKAAANNSQVLVGSDGTNITLTEREGAIDYNQFDLTQSGGWTGFVKTGTASTSGLRLQIGDNSQVYNQLNVAVQDMHVSALNLSDIDITTQNDAAAAVDKIKAAINSVSSVRGTLGATQNRLEHTSNNLSVMEENIQNAESAIRDTDVADEMTQYTKNNILLQSAQAMLAQANQMPQGVLQLLQ